MRNYVFQIISLLLSILASSFEKNSAPKTNKGFVTLFFQGSNFFQTSVEDEAKWSTTFTPSFVCSNQPKEVACAITISDNYTNFDGTLTSDCEIIASDPNSDGKYKVIDVQLVINHTSIIPTIKNANLP